MPTSFSSLEEQADIYPDYRDIVIPPNIAPLNFQLRDSLASDMVVEITSCPAEGTTGKESTSLLVAACEEELTLRLDTTEWRNLLTAHRGQSLRVHVYAQHPTGWVRYRSHTLTVAQEDIDAYLSYRLIEPGYEMYRQLGLYQRNLTNWDVHIIYENNRSYKSEDNHCINCHNYQNYSTEKMLFHVRANHGGTILVEGDKARKVQVKDSTILTAGVYPSWHPKHPWVAFSTNKTGQSFHTKDLNKIEVQDTESDLILYDVDKNEVSIISELEDELEVFPTWSPDGKTLYFCSAKFEYKNDSIAKETEMIQRYKEVKYNIYAADFNPDTKEFSNMHVIYNAADSLGKSATLPRVSPDGRHLLFAQAEYGCFHVWHNDADIYMLDLKTLKAEPVKNVNSDRSESYPTWSSNGRWIMVDSRRQDGNYTRPYIAYYDRQGKVHKAFVLPQKDPNFYTFYLRCFNRPEFMVEPVKVTPQEFAKKAKEDAIPAKYAK